MVKYRVAWHLLVYKRQHVGWHFTVFQHHTEHGYLVYRIAIGDVERGWGNLRHPRHASHIVDKALLLTSIHLQVLIERSLGLIYHSLVDAFLRVLHLLQPCACHLCHPQLERLCLGKRNGLY